ncbi:hypothetical protein LCGC14_0513720 [marine sediment metagenome]|uniref:Uncharacterized protein n=1 Tax=marine sediment metagenome TaxID=412755 RepID=A0A0F9S0F0_9ZZZZ
MTEKTIRDTLIEWVTDYKDVAERNALAETPEESADYLLTVEVAGIPLSELIEKAKSGKLVELDGDQSLPANPYINTPRYGAARRLYYKAQEDMAGFRRVRVKGE